MPNKYAPKDKIGTPTIGRTPNFVKSVGLENYKKLLMATLTYDPTPADQPEFNLSKSKKH